VLSHSVLLTTLLLRTAGHVALSLVHLLLNSTSSAVMHCAEISVVKHPQCTVSWLWHPQL